MIILLTIIFIIFKFSRFEINGISAVNTFRLSHIFLPFLWAGLHENSELQTWCSYSGLSNNHAGCNKHAGLQIIKNNYSVQDIINMVLALAKKGPFLKKTSDFQKNLGNWSLGPPELISKEFLFPALNRESLADLKVLKICSFEISRLSEFVKASLNLTKFFSYFRCI